MSSTATAARVPAKHVKSKRAGYVDDWSDLPVDSFLAFISSRTASFKRPLLSVDVPVCLCV